jgi:hypothetical protein
MEFFLQELRKHNNKHSFHVRSSAQNLAGHIEIFAVLIYETNQPEAGTTFSLSITVAY